MAARAPSVHVAGDPDPVAVRAELERILRSDLFARSDRLSAFLTFIVEETLAGRAATLKEGVIAMAVYGREADFTGAADPIVRVDARRLRDKLREYYAAAPPSAVIISVPKGSYAPAFNAPATELAAAPPRDADRTGPLRQWPLVASAALTVVVVSAVAIWLISRAPSRPPAIRSLAVLPLANLSGDASQAYFADGLTEALITRLAGVHGLKVISRTSVLRFRDAAPPVPEIARLLGVEAVIEGGVVREGDRVRITVRLVNGSDGRSEWAQTYERELGDVLALHSEVAHGIAERVAVTLTDVERSRLGQKHPVHPEAYDQYLWGRFAARRATRSAIEESAVYYQRAIDADPTFAAAHAGLAHAYNNLATLLIGAAPPTEMRPRAMAAALRALALDPDLAEAHAELGFAYMRDWRWQEAGAAFRRAIELSPNDAEILAKYSDYLGAQGRAEEGIAMARRALERDPLSPYVTHNMGVQLYAARRYADAVHHMEAVLNVDPKLAEANIVVGLALLEQREFDRAIEALQRAAELHDRSPAALGLLANAYARSGRTADARAVLQELEARSRDGYVPPLAFVYAYTGLGERDRAFAWLERAYEERSNLLAFLKTFPVLDPLRGDPRFEDLLRRVNLK